VHLVAFDLDLLNDFLLISYAILSLHYQTLGDSLDLCPDRSELVSVILNSVDPFLFDH
jgi:hypothetical protein